MGKQNPSTFRLLSISHKTDKKIKNPHLSQRLFSRRILVLQSRGVRSSKEKRSSEEHASNILKYRVPPGSINLCLEIFLSRRLY